MNLNNKFVALGRTFHELSKDAGESDDVDIGRAFHVGKRMGWPDVVALYRVVLLSEAGSGKTVEIRNVARVLRAEGKAAFFLRLEHVSNDFETSLKLEPTRSSKLGSLS